MTVAAWEAAVAAAAEHRKRRPDLCVTLGDECDECEYDGCYYNACDLYNDLSNKVGETHRAMVEAARSQDALTGKPNG